MSLAANAGPDQAVAVDVPVILDGTASTDATTYFWNQTSGARQTFIGFDRPKAMVIGLNVGTYVFTLTVSDGLTTNVDSMTITVTAPTGTVRYADNLLAADTTTYSIANRNNAGSDGFGYKLIQSAVTAAVAGDTIYVRAGTYTNTTISGGVQPYVKFSINGTATAPIRLQNYNAEHVILNGTGFQDADLDHNGLADGPLISGIDERLIWVNADYIQVVGLDIQNSGKYGVYWDRSHGYMNECTIHDNWLPGMWLIGNLVGGTLTGTVIHSCESYRNRHGSGSWFGPSSAIVSTLTMNAYVDNLFYNNGFVPDGTRVLGFSGDSEGGGNSDGLTGNKFAVQTLSSQTSGTLTIGGYYQIQPFVAGDDFLNVGGLNLTGTAFIATATTPTVWTHGSTVQHLINYMPNNFFVRNILYHNSDDGLDQSTTDSLIEDNYSMGNGPTASQGFKVFIKTKNVAFRGNVLYFNLGRGIDNRFLNLQTNPAFNNSVLRNQQQGLFSALSNVKNNACAFNVLTDFSASDGGGHNWAEDGANVDPSRTGDPGLINGNLGTPSVTNFGGGGTNTNPSANYFLDFGFSPTDTVVNKWRHVANQVVAAFTPSPSSGLINQGVLIAGYHCPTADDDPITPADPTDPRRHWVGSAPDIGAFEFGIVLGTDQSIISLSGNMAFGNVIVGGNAMSTLSVVNTGALSFDVFSVTYPSKFTGLTTGFTVGPGSSHDITVTYTPTGATNDSGTIVVDSNADTGVESISCSGTGVLAGGGQGKGKKKRKNVLISRF